MVILISLKKPIAICCHIFSIIDHYQILISLQNEIVKKCSNNSIYQKFISNTTFVISDFEFPQTILGKCRLSSGRLRYYNGTFQTRKYKLYLLPPTNIVIEKVKVFDDIFIAMGVITVNLFS